MWGRIQEIKVTARNWTWGIKVSICKALEGNWIINNLEWVKYK